MIKSVICFFTHSSSTSSLIGVDNILYIIVLLDIGERCDIDHDECASSPCLNGALCTHAVDIFSCSCLQGFVGENCGTNIDECLSSPCGNGATCTDGFNTYSCDCPNGFAGRYHRVKQIYKIRSSVTTTSYKFNQV